MTRRESATLLTVLAFMVAFGVIRAEKANESTPCTDNVAYAPFVSVSNYWAYPGVK